ncbi:hypothetical protein LNV23_03150 [Paucibacter sp. DJ1R-11]|uniref:hypothetical protein n=1 Tax=Paucibacter sp. DJ1R-11 TaxID=2893556 RepID=UPI0021E39F86|nr:hypothetical protein [Paucibacter sp. DJ1R-11]MCV2362443.1 hypothetical protein [Paucibacter sp. DJ1R-11]
MLIQSLPRSIRVLGLLAAGIPASAQASIHGDMAPVFGLLVGAGGILRLGILGMLYACYLFWKWNRADWLFAAVVALIAPSLLMGFVGLIPGLMGSSGGGVAMTVITVITFILGLVNWGFLWFALREKKRRAQR